MPVVLQQGAADGAWLHSDRSADAGRQRYVQAVAQTIPDGYVQVARAHGIRQKCCMPSP